MNTEEIRIEPGTVAVAPLAVGVAAASEARTLAAPGGGDPSGGLARGFQVARELQARGAFAQAHKQYARSLAACAEAGVEPREAWAHASPASPVIASLLLGDTAS